MNNFLKDKIIAWLDTHRVKNYTLVPDAHYGFIVDVEGDVRLTKAEAIEVQFGHINGSFDCSYSKLKSLKGSPRTVAYQFNCKNNHLTSLVGGPQVVGENFEAANNFLINLMGSPVTVGGNFNCDNNNLVSIEGAPKVIPRTFSVSGNDIRSLLDGPESVGAIYDLHYNSLTSLEHLPSKVEHLIVSSNHLKSLAANTTVKILTASSNSIESLEGMMPVADSLYIAGNNLTSLRGAPANLTGTLRCENNQLTSLTGCPECLDVLYINGNPLKTLKGIASVVGSLSVDSIEIDYLPDRVEDSFLIDGEPADFEALKEKCNILEEQRCLAVEIVASAPSKSYKI